jgi:hypothetical protein
MRKVRFITIDAGPGGVRHPGQVVDVSDEEAAALIAGKHAVYVEAPARETTAVRQPETATPPASVPRTPRGPRGRS